MADESYDVAVAIGLQTAFGTVNATIAGLASPLVVSDGILLGDKGAGDFESGITVPSFARIERDKADVPASFSRQASSFERVDPEGMSIQWQFQGNGSTATPVVGEAQPNVGIDALIEMAGTIGANGGSNAEYEYTPRHSASATGGSTKYGTIKLWVGTDSYVLQDVVVESLTWTLAPSGIVVARADLRIGSHDPATQKATGVTFPTLAFGNQATLNAPSVVNVTTTYGSARGWQALTVEIRNALETGEDSAQPNGLRTRQVGRSINVVARLFVDSADPDFDYQELIAAVAPTADVQVQIGTANTGGATTLNAFNLFSKNISLESIRDTNEGDVKLTDFSGHATTAAVGGEFTLTMN